MTDELVMAIFMDDEFRGQYATVTKTVKARL